MHGFSHSMIQGKKDRNKHKEVDYNQTMMQFPSPNQDTQSTFQQDDNRSDFTQGSAIANQFHYKDKLTPTSPIVFNDMPSDSSHDQENLLFNPHDSTYGSISPNIVEVKTPLLKDILADFQQFLILSKPPPISLNTFFELLSITIPNVERLCNPNIVIRNFIRLFSQKIEKMNQQNFQSEQEIAKTATKFEEEVPYFLENFQQFPETDQQNLITGFQNLALFYNLQYLKKVNTRILKLEVDSSRDQFIRNYNELLKSYQTVLSSNDKRIEKYHNYQELSIKLNQARQENNSTGHDQKYFLLKECLSFNITKIERNRMTVHLPNSAKPEVTDNIINIHSKIASNWRNIQFEQEVNEISKIFPFVAMHQQVTLYVTFVKYNEPEVRFDVGFHIPISYPYCFIKADTRVVIGNKSSISAKVNKICEECSLKSRKPILEICQTIMRTFIDKKNA
ncbi:hypothetical protein TRFO_14687 [Tritrichomonas foetus]|uniref:Uncharacterized protein n=1 Tax=Tritrichomonas foetus TaxID=1144522 RepID=A0A1J4KUE8_9EUKA|nr:hypothetical protein TRFO_14687 [Tritrichomonas foetus]|eukprot:OHT14895.1 hypothetical protein TRFO_14687 [Tritrichomonas foetus]